MSNVNDIKTVGDLVKALQRHPQDAEVCTREGRRLIVLRSDYELNRVVIGWVIGEIRCKARWVAGFVDADIPDGARCVLAEHGPEVKHEWKRK